MRWSRKRILLIFLLIRYTGAKLNEVLALNPFRDIAWVVLFKGDGEPGTSADNRFRGTINRMVAGAVNTEYVVRIADGTELCSLVTSESSRRLDLHVNDPVWAVFNSFSVVLHVD